MAADAKWLLPTVAIALAVALLSISTSCSPSCQNENTTFTGQPNGDYVAYKFNRNCGATTDVNVQVAVVRSNEEASGIGNVFVADGRGDRPVSDPVTAVKTQWIGNALKVVYDKRLRVFKKEPKADDVRIIYSPT